MLVASCSSENTSGPAQSASSGTASGAGGSGALACSANSDGTCSCEWDPAATGPTPVACFADKRPASLSPNLCCAKNFNGSGPAAGYSCTCAPPAASAGTWSCQVFPSTNECTCKNVPAGGQLNLGGEWKSADPSTCKPMNGHKCGYNATTGYCACNPGFDEPFPAVDTCAVPPANVAAPKVCPSGTAPVDACDGNCHPETCFGSAGQECDVTGCTDSTYECVGNRCQKL